MAELTQRLTKKALLLAALDVAGVPQVPTVANDAIEISDHSYGLDTAFIDRGIVSGSLSNALGQTGAKKPTMTFTVEFKGNGKVNDGLTAPLITRLLQACGYDLKSTLARADATLVIPDWGNNPNTNLVFTVAGTVSAGFTKPVLYRIRTVVAGVSGTAKFRIVSNDLSADDTSALADVVVTSGTAIPLGASGITLSPAFTGIIHSGVAYSVLVLPKGMKMTPISKDIPAVTLWMYKDGQVHRMPNARGTFKITAPAGEIAKIEFTFQGGYIKPTDVATPANPTYQDAVLPPLVEFSNFTWRDSLDLVAQQWTFDQANTVSPRMDVNSDDGLRGYRITGRKPTGGFNPEATLNSDFDFYADLDSGNPNPFFAKVGTARGNQCVFLAPRAQLSGLPYGDRDGTLTYEASFNVAQITGDDETLIFFG